MHDFSPSSTSETFKLNVNTSEGQCKLSSTPSRLTRKTLTRRGRGPRLRVVWIPQFAEQITINGHQSKIIVTDFNFGRKSLLYSTAEVLTYSVIDNKEVLVLWLPAGESGEFAIKGEISAKVSSPDGSKLANSTKVELHEGAANLTVSYTQGPGMTLVDLSDGSRVVLLDRSAAYRFWVPTLGNDPLAPENSTGEPAKSYLPIYPYYLPEAGAVLRLMLVSSTGPRPVSGPLCQTEHGNQDSGTDRRSGRSYYGDPCVCAKESMLSLVEWRKAQNYLQER